MTNNVRYTAAKRREVAARHAAEMEARDRAFAAMTLEEYLTEARLFDTAQGQEFLDFHTAHHADLVARFAA
jgi:hypothetical protein